MSQIEVEVGPWRAAVVGSADTCRLDPSGTFDDLEQALDPPLVDERSATVEIRRAAGGHWPWALLGAAHRPAPGKELRYQVAHTGELGSDLVESCVGLFGRELKVGLPSEFALAALDGLVRFSGAPIRPGHVVVVSGGYDDVDSSSYIFERAAGLLKWVLLTQFPDPLPSSEQLATFLKGWSEG
jgi:hypothetical protein